MQIIQRPDFPTLIDSSMRGAFVACPRKFLLAYLNGFTTAGTPVDLHAGASFARGVEMSRRTYYGLGVSEYEALRCGLIAFTKEWGDFEAPIDHVKSYERMFGALVLYFDTWPLSQDSFKPLRTPIGPAVEFTFAIPIDGTSHPVTGDPILYGGRFDALGEMNGLCLVEDDKTTKSLGALWGNQWTLRGQFTGYIWAARQHGYQCEGALVRGISILKESYGTAQVLVMKTPHDINLWLIQLRRDINRMIACWKEGYWDYSLDEACASYRGCSFMPLCASPNPENWLEPAFIQRTYDPLGLNQGPPTTGPTAQPPTEPTS